METYPENTKAPRGRAKTAITAEHETVMAGYDAYLARALPGKSGKTYSSAVRQFLVYLEGCTDHDDTALDGGHERDFAARDYARHMKNAGMSPATVNKHLAALDNYFDAYRHLGKAQRADGGKIRREEIPVAEDVRWLDVNDARRYARAVERLDSARDRLMALLPLYAGLRVSEVAGLDLSDVTLTARKGTIRVLGKGSKVRTVPVSPELRPALETYLRERGTEAGPLFRSRFGTRQSPEAVNDVIRRLAEREGMARKVTAHVLRHTCGKTMLRDGKADIVVVARVLGHSRLETTRLYAAPSIADLEDAVASVKFDA